MLTAKQNMREVIKGGAPDRFVNQYEAVKLLFHPAAMQGQRVKKGGEPVVNAWGVTNCYPENVPGPYPVHTPDKIVVKDIARWRDYVKAPSLDFPQEMWDMCKSMYNAVDGEKAYKATFIAPGLFEQCHHLCSMQEALMGFLLYPQEMKDLIKYIADWELELAEGICTHLKPDAIFHHDDWGSELNSFMHPDMFAEFFVEPYKRIYGYYHEHGVELVIHHSDGYAANLVPHMIEMGIDVWQGCLKSSNVPQLIEKYGGKISFMGEIDNKQVDFDGWTDDDCKKAAATAIERCGSGYFIPCIVQGGPGSVYPGAYDSLTRAIDEYNSEKFGFTQAELEAARMPSKTMF